MCDPDSTAHHVLPMFRENVGSKLDMRFLAAGPDFPDELLEARDAGNVVFFCGAGISRPAGLPRRSPTLERLRVPNP
jgi:hypothetical protein